MPLSAKPRGWLGCSTSPVGRVPPQRGGVGSGNSRPARLRAATALSGPLVASGDRTVLCTEVHTARNSAISGFKAGFLSSSSRRHGRSVQAHSVLHSVETNAPGRTGAPISPPLPPPRPAPVVFLSERLGIESCADAGMTSKIPPSMGLPTYYLPTYLAIAYLPTHQPTSLAISTLHGSSTVHWVPAVVGLAKPSAVTPFIGS